MNPHKPSADSNDAQPTQSWGREAALTVAAGAVLLVFCATLLVRDPGYFWSDDYQTANLPGLVDSARAWRQGEMPLLSASSWRGGALASEYPNGVFAPLPTLCVLVAIGLGLSLPLTAALVSAIHLAVLAGGAFRLGRHRGMSTDLALLVALIGSLNGFVFFSGGRIWIPYLVSFAWIPWFWWALERGLEEQRSWTRFVLPGIFLALVIVAGWHFTVVMAGILTVWLLLRTWTRQRRLKPLWPTLAAWVVGLGLSAPAWLMLLEFIPSTSRGKDDLVWLYAGSVVSFDSLPGLLFPHVSVSQVWDNWKPHLPIELFGGLVPVVILTASLFHRGARSFRTLGWEWGLCAFMFFLATSPSIGNFRFSQRWLPLFFLALGVLAGQSLAVQRAVRLPGDSVPGDDARPNLGRWCFFLVLIVWCRALLLAFGPTLMLSGVAVGFLVVSFLWLQVEGRCLATSWARRSMPWIVVLATSWLTYTTCVPFSEVATWPMGEQVRRPEPLDSGIRYVSLYTPEDMWDYDPNRILEPTRGKPVQLYIGNSALYSGLEFVNGYSPTKPAGLEEILPFRDQGYTTLEEGKRLLEAETGPRGLLQLLGVDGLVVSDRFASERPRLVANGWQEVARLDGGVVFHRDGPRSARVRAVEQAEVVANRAEVPPRVACQDSKPFPIVLVRTEAADRQAFRFSPAEVTAVRETRNAVVVDVAAGGNAEALIVFSRPWYPGFRASLDGQPVPVELANLILPAVRLPAGSKGRLVLEYRPRSLVFGGWWAAATGVFIGAIVMLALAKWLRRSPQVEMSVSANGQSKWGQLIGAGRDV